MLQKQISVFRNGVLRKSLGLILLGIFLSAAMLGCALMGGTQVPEQEAQEQLIGEYVQREYEEPEVPVASQVDTFEPNETPNTPNNAESLAQADDLSDEELAELTVHFSQFDVNPDVWWILGQNIDVDLEAEPFGEEMFRPVGRFDNIAEMKDATEQIVSRRFAEEHLYTVLDGPIRMFLERDGRLYFSTRGEGVWRIPVAVEGHIVSRNENEAIVAVTHHLDGGEFVSNLRMVRESGGWRYDGRENEGW